MKGLVPASRDPDGDPAPASHDLGPCIPRGVFSDPVLLPVVKEETIPRDRFGKIAALGHPERERWFREAWAKTGKKLDMGKSCLRFRKLDDLALEVIGEAIRRLPARAFIQEYETIIKTMLRRPAGRTSAKWSRAKPRQSSVKSVAAKRRK